MKSFLAVKQAHVRFGSVVAVQEASLTLGAGEIGCLLGPSGCGKTSLLRAIAGFESIQSGQIELAGKILANDKLHVRVQERKIGMVFQDYALFPHLSVLNNVGFGLHHLDRKQRDQRAREWLEVVDLLELADRYPHELSGGQQQRVALARTLATEPQLVLLDEPFSNLDAILRERLASDVRTLLKKRQLTALMVTHDQQEAFAFADAMGVMSAGRLLQWDTPYAIYHEPREQAVANFVGEGVLLQGHVQHDGQIHFTFGESHYCLLRQPGHTSQVHVLLRPDDILHDDSSAFQARVTNKTFRGAQFLYELELTSGERCFALVPSHHNHAIGEWIGIRLELDHLVVFADDHPSSDGALTPQA